MVDLPKVLRSFRYAARGLRALFYYENNARVHLAAAALVGVVAAALRVSRADWCWLLTAIALVWITETINTALEKLVDLVSPEHHPLAGRVKDLAAGAVLLAAAFSALIGVLVLGPYLF